MLNRRFLFVQAAGDMYLFGTALALLGAVLLPLSHRFQLDPAHSGNLFLTMDAGVLLACLSGGLLLDRIGIRPVLLTALLLLGGGLWGLAIAPSIQIATVCVFTIGMAGGGINTSVNTLISRAFESNRKSALNGLAIFFGCGAIVLSSLIGTLRDAWTTCLQVIAVLAWIWAAIAWLGKFPFPAASENRGFSSREILRMLRDPFLIAMAVLILCQMGNEVTIGGWITTFLSRELGASTRAATLVLSGYWCAIVLGRLISATLLRWTQASYLVAACGLGATIATFVLLTSGTFISGAVAAFFLGLCYSTILPTTLAMVGDQFSRYSGTVFGTLLAIGLMGSMTFPWITGHVARSFGLRLGLVVPLIGAVVITLVEFSLMRKKPSELLSQASESM
jgi:fucose permease